MRLILIIALLLSSIACAQVKELATYKYTVASKYMDRAYDQVFPLSEERQVLAVFCDKEKDARVVKLLLLDSLLKPFSEKVIRYGNAEDLCMARVKDQTIYALFYDIKSGKATTRNYSLNSLETIEEYKFELPRGIEFKDFEILNQVYFVGGTNTLAFTADPNVVYSINKGKLVSGVCKYEKMSVQYYPKLFVVEHEDEPEFFAVYDDQNNYTPDNYIVRFNKHGERLPDIFLKEVPIPLQTDVYLHDFSAKKVSADNYALLGIYSSSTKPSKRGVFTARLNKGEIMFFKKYRFCDLDGFNEAHFIKDTSCTKNTYETTIKVLPIKGLNGSYYSVIEFGYDTKFRAAAVVMLDKKGEWLWSQAFRIILKRNLVLHDKKATEEFAVQCFDEKTLYVRRYNSEKFVDETEYVLNKLINDELYLGYIVAEFWYEKNILVYDDANHILQSKFEKDFSIRKIGK